MSDDLFESLFTQLDAAAPALSSGGLIQRLRAPSREVAVEWSAAVVATVGLRILVDQQGAPPEVVGSAVSAELRRLKLTEPAVGDLFTERLNRLLTLRSIVFTSKAFDLATEHEHPFGQARILTDIRAIFEPQDELLKTGAALIVHVLKLRDRHGEEFYTALGPSDLRDLQSVISRAQQKEEQLRNRLTTAGVQCLDDEPPSKSESR
jgi:hypothetical protein